MVPVLNSLNIQAAVYGNHEFGNNNNNNNTWWICCMYMYTCSFRPRDTVTQWVGWYKTLCRDKLFVDILDTELWLQWNLHFHCGHHWTDGGVLLISETVLYTKAASDIPEGVLIKDVSFCCSTTLYSMYMYMYVHIVRLSEYYFLSNDRDYVFALLYCLMSE